jgi:hypothetical protein
MMTARGLLRIHIALAFLAFTNSAVAQVTVPGVVIRNDASPTVSVSATQAAAYVAMRAARLQAALPLLGGVDPKDTLRTIVTESAMQWRTRLEAKDTRGIQQDFYSRLLLEANHPELAQQQLAARLATPGLSLADKAYTYFAGVVLFANAEYPERLPIAEQYLVALDALGGHVAARQFMAHRQLAGVYYALGRSTDVVRHGTHAITLVSAMEFIDREMMYKDPRFYSEIIDALAAQPNSRAQMSVLNAALENAAVPSAPLIAQDSNFYWKGTGYRAMLQEMENAGMRVGTPAQAIEGNYWVNLPRSDPFTMSVTDGTIHVLEVGHYSCGPCIAALGTLQRLQDRFPTARMVYATTTEGSWGYRLAEPAEETPHLVEFYTKQLKLRFPISIWQGPLQRNVDGGMTPDPSGGPNFTHYQLVSKPTIYVIDGRGIIRRVFVGGITPDREAQLATLITFLQREAATPSTASTPSAPAF